MTLITALIIKSRGDDIKCSAAKDKNSKKWMGFISLYNDGYFHTHLLSSDPIYDSRKIAEDEMKKTVEYVREMELRSPPEMI